MACIIGDWETLIGKALLTDVTCYPPILLVHGDADAVVPVEQMYRTA